MTEKSRQEAGILAMAGCAFLWSLAGIFIKLVDWQPFAIAGGRSLVAAVFLFAWLRKPRFRFTRLQVAGAVAYALTMLLFVYANKRTTSANAILLQYGAPVYVALLAPFLLKERARAEHWVALAAVAAGMALFFMGGLGGGSLAGNIVAMLSGVTFAVQIILMRKQKDASPLESLLLGHVITAVAAFGISLFMPAPTVTPKAAAAIIGLGVLQIGMAAVLFAYGIKRVTALQGVLVAVIEPIFNPLWVFLATGETPGIGAIAGGSIIIVAVMASSAVSVRRAGAAAAALRPNGGGE